MTGAEPETVECGHLHGEDEKTIPRLPSTTAPLAEELNKTFSTTKRFTVV